MYAGAPTSVKGTTASSGQPDRSAQRRAVSSRAHDDRVARSPIRRQLSRPHRRATEPIGAPDEHIELVEHYSAHNYHPLPIVVAEAEGAWVTDVDGKRYLDMLSAYSALELRPSSPRPDRARRTPSSTG